MARIEARLTSANSTLYRKEYQLSCKGQSGGVKRSSEQTRSWFRVRFNDRTKQRPNNASQSSHDSASVGASLPLVLVMPSFSPFGISFPADLDPGACPAYGAFRGGPIIVL